MKPVRKRGAPKAKQPKVRTDAFVAPMLAIYFPDILRERLLDPEVTLSPAERKHIARHWQPKQGKGKRGRPKPPAWIAPVESLAMARFYIWAAYHGRAPGDRNGEQEAESATVKNFACERRVLERHREAALNWQSGKWWQAACWLAQKNKREELLQY
jgi:hypothetical protein